MVVALSDGEVWPAHRAATHGSERIEVGELLEPEELVEVVQRQRSQRMPIGQALVRLGHVQHDRLGLLLDAFLEGVKRAPTPGISETLRTLACLFALERLEADRAVALLQATGFGVGVD